ncbi:MAG: hypothetical protein JO168_12900 [Solirubrobacterales bacterium]|nr:hypothetical protein [Solirubrobacterales bacterium]
MCPSSSLAASQSHGLAALALAYFGARTLPRTLVEVPLEYVERAACWLRDREHVSGDLIGLLGGSKGAELALLSAATFPSLIGPVVAAAPSSVVWYGLELTPGHLAAAIPSTRSSWSLHGAPVPFVPASSAKPIATVQGLRLDPCYAHNSTTIRLWREPRSPLSEAPDRSCCSPAVMTTSGLRPAWARCSSVECLVTAVRTTSST